ncbi:MAG: hypothetical protein WCA85_26090 [Paraburkholderia sp.]|uniref:hypothetical protein n=1 Tax=Paraburkholderia sp. TaxID=1926495 RepID=UPI003C3BC8F0
MSTVVATLSTVESDQPATTAAQGGITFTLSGGAPSQLIAAAPYSASFSDVAPGSYTVTTQAVDVNGNAVGAAVTSEEFAVAAPVQYNLPSGLNISVQ